MKETHETVREASVTLARMAVTMIHMEELEYARRALTGSLFFCPAYIYSPGKWNRAEVLIYTVNRTIHKHIHILL